MFSEKITVLSVLILLTTTQATNYCSSSLCGSNGPHIACGNTGAFVSTCPAGARLIDLNPLINTILNYHNSKRNLIASGGLSGFKPATRMATMQWDPELAYLASLNVRQCVMAHDKCRNTDNFKFAGQNLAAFMYSGPEKGFTDSFIINHSINGWWNEYKNANQTYIDKYPSNYNGPTIGHFTALVVDRSIRVGCGAARFFDGSWNQFLFACDYASTNIIGQPIYISGPAVSGCKTPSNSTYASLCSTAEKYTNL